MAGPHLAVVDFDRPLPKVDLGDVVVIPDDFAAAIPPSADVQMVLKSAAKLKRLAPDAICVTDPLAFTGCGCDGKALDQVQLAYRNGIARAISWGQRPVHPVTVWRKRLAVALDALQTTTWECGGVQTHRAGPGYRRRSPVETTNVALPTGDRLQIPTGAETLRFKGYLIMSRNSSHDYADFADLVDTMAPETAAAVLAGMDRYYSCQAPGRQWMATQLVGRLADPQPSDLGDQSPGADAQAKWEEVRRRCLSVAVAMLEEAR